MNTVFLHIMLIFSTKNTFIQPTGNTCIQVISVELQMNTTYQIKCEQFEKEFADMFNVHQINNSDSINTFKQYIQHAKYSRKESRLDVRRKFLYFEDGKVKATICSDGYSLQLNGCSLKDNAKLLAFLESMILE